MSNSLSVDLRERVVAEGASCRAAAARFGVSVSSAIRWCGRLRETGSLLPRALGGDRRSGRIEAHAPRILEAVARTPDLTLAELRCTKIVTRSDGRSDLAVGDQAEAGARACSPICFSRAVGAASRKVCIGVLP